MSPAAVRPDMDGNEHTREGNYRHVRVADLPGGFTPARSKKEVDEAVGATTFGFNVYEADPGEMLPWGTHRHPAHEELFYVLEGELVVETPDREYVVGPGEAFFVPTDHRNRARGGEDGPVRVVAVGAPKASDTSIIEEYCEVCDEVTRREYELVDDTTDETDGDADGDDREGGRVVVLSCRNCGTETRRF